MLIDTILNYLIFTLNYTFPMLCIELR